MSLFIGREFFVFLDIDWPASINQFETFERIKIVLQSEHKNKQEEISPLTAQVPIRELHSIDQSESSISSDQLNFSIHSSTIQ